MGLAGVLSGQEDTASLSITVTDPSNALVPGAHVVLTDSHWGKVRTANTTETGTVAFDSLRSGDYSLEASKTGFDKIHIGRVVLALRDRVSVHVELKISTAENSVTVSDVLQGVATDVSFGVASDHDYFQNLPVNGRNPDALVMMTPGITSAGGGRGGEGFNVNGLRSNTNYYTLDGVSVNNPVGGGGPIGGGFMGGGPMGGGIGGGMGGAMDGAMGGAGGAISMDALQEMRVQTSSFAPEFGRTPGAQVSMTSRGGTNNFHGSLFYYFRNDRLNANDWFANASGYPRNEMRQNRPGGAIGGPIIKNRTYFFLSYEALRLATPYSVIADVPDLVSRETADPTMRPYLNAFPVANGATVADGVAEFRTVVTNPSKSDVASIRFDHMLNDKTNLFARYSLSLSDNESRGSELSSANVLTTRNSRSHVFTAGGTRTSSATLLHDVRFNYSRSQSSGDSVMDSLGGAVPLSADAVFPGGVTLGNGEFNLSILGGGGYSLSPRSRTKQDQFNGIYSLTYSSPAHTTKLGVDYRRTMPTYYRTPYSLNVIFNGYGGDTGSLFSGVATNAQVTSALDQVYPVFTNLSVYWQDTWRATERTTLTFGTRWEFNPAPGVRQGPQPLAYTGTDTLSQDQPLYKRRWLDFAPRLGLAYQMDTTQGREMMFRMGAGAFYDVGYGVSVGTFNGAPYSNVRTISLAEFPLAEADLAAPVMPPTVPYGQITAADPALKAPVVFQWNATIERYFGSGQMLSIGYVGNEGRRLLRTESTPSFSDVYQVLRLASNGATSAYHGLQVQFRRRLSANLQTQLSYTYSHAIDDASSDSGFGFAYLSGGERGSSDYDIRHSLNWSGSYRLRAPAKGLFGHLLGDWYADWMATYRSGLPFDVQGVSSETGNSNGGLNRDLNQRAGLFAQVRPDYNGQPLWIDDPTVPGGRRLNRDAFTIPDGYQQGNLGRNALRGWGASQIDLALRRQLSLSERLRLNISAQAYNVLNHPNFANLSPNQGTNLSSTEFGTVTRMMNQGFGGGASIYSSGGPRSVELAVRLQF